MKILSIGNSFSDDAQRYLRAIAASDGMDITTLNLCIGGCSLERHYSNMKSGAREYLFHYNGDMSDDKLVTLDEGLALCEWDIVTLQQVSVCSFREESYYPYITELAGYVRAKLPGAKIYIQQTWAYETGCERVYEVTGGKDAAFMLDGIRKAYIRACKEIGADGIIPSGELMELLRLKGASPIYRDTLHASFGLGRYALGLLWYHVLTGRGVLNNSFYELDEPVDDEMLSLARELANSLQIIKP